MQVLTLTSELQGSSTPVTTPQAAPEPGPSSSTGPSDDARDKENDKEEEKGLSKLSKLYHPMSSASLSC